ncbi:MAG: carboxypeptidase regulatory-like domain-containing protein, partial [Planctomycetota bacterium]
MTQRVWTAVAVVLLLALLGGVLTLLLGDGAPRDSTRNQPAARNADDAADNPATNATSDNTGIAGNTPVAPPDPTPPADNAAPATDPPPGDPAPTPADEPRARHIFGRAVDGDGNPMADVEVLVLLSDRDNLPMPATPPGMTTGADGRFDFRIPVSGPRPAGLRLTHARGLSATHGLWTYMGMEIDTGDIPLGEPGSVMITVLGPDGVPADGATVELKLFGIELIAPDSGATEGGIARYSDLRPGTYSFFVTHPRWFAARAYNQCVVQSGEQYSAEVQLSEAHDVHLLVQNAAQLPIADAAVKVAGLDEPLRTGADGRVMVPAANTASIEVSAEGYDTMGVWQHRGATDPLAEIVVTLVAVSTISGRLVDADGNATGPLGANDRPRLELRISNRRVRPDEQWNLPERRFTLTNVAEGAYVLRLEFHDGTLPIELPVRVEAGHPTDLGDIRVGGNGSLVVRLVDGAGQPITDGYVSASVTGADGVARDGGGSADASGEFTLRGFRAGDVLGGMTAATRDRLNVGSLDGTPLTLSYGMSPLVIRLGAWPVVKGRVVDASGQPLAAAGLFCGPQEAGRKVSFNYAQTDADGRFGFEHLVPGDYKLVPTDVRNTDAPGLIMFSVKPGDVLDLKVAVESAMMRRGRVVDADGNPPSKPVRVIPGLHHPGNLPKPAPMTDSQGRFAVVSGGNLLTVAVTDGPVIMFTLPADQVDGIVLRLPWSQTAGTGTLRVQIISPHGELMRNLSTQLKLTLGVAPGVGGGRFLGPDHA